jgi:predicted RNase H-like nuclease
MTIIGLDGCKGGWMLSKIVFDGAQSTLTIELIDSLERLNDVPFSWCFVDIPIGLTGGGIERTLDQQMRSLLSKNRKSSIFTAPCRRAVYAIDYDSAKKKNLEETGKSISIQAWNICPKIKEMDQFLQLYPTLTIFESHPELCFEKLNKNIPLVHSKKSSDGKKERRQLILKLFPEFKESLETALSNYKSYTDDVLDAVCLTVMGFLGATHQFNTVKESQEWDSKKIRMNAYYFERV